MGYGGATTALSPTMQEHPSPKEYTIPTMTNIPSLTTVLEKAPAWLAQAHQASTAPWVETVLRLSDLHPMRIDEDPSGYQRPISQSRVDDLVDKFDAGEARSIYVSLRSDGTMWILDGQHTWAALTQMGFDSWPCRVFFNLTVPEEARRFAAYQSNTRRIPPVVQFNAEVIAKSPTASALDKILGDYYLRISSSKLRTRDGYLGVTSRAVFQKVYELGGEKLLREVLQIAVDAWGQRKESYFGRVLQGMGYLFAYAEGEFDRERMIAVLQNTTTKQLVEKIGPTGSGGASRAGAFAILSEYLDGAPGFAKIRINSKDSPHLPETPPKDGPEPKNIWTPESTNFGRKKPAAMVTEQTVKAHISANEAQALAEEDAVMAQDQFEQAMTDPDRMTTDPVPVIATPMAAAEEEEDWSYPDTQG